MIAVSISNSDVMLSSNNDIILQSEGEGVKKGWKMAVILKVCPLKRPFAYKYRKL